MPKVFISHSTDDSNFVKNEIIFPLNSSGIETWYSQENIKTASDWENSIQQGLESSEWFLVVLTPRALDSRWVKAEVSWAVKNRPEKIIPVYAETCDWGKLNLILHTIQYVDFRHNCGEARKKLLSLLDTSNKSNEQKKVIEDIYRFKEFGSATSGIDKQSKSDFDEQLEGL